MFAILDRGFLAAFWLLCCLFACLCGSAAFAQAPAGGGLPAGVDLSQLKSSPAPAAGPAAQTAQGNNGQAALGNNGQANEGGSGVQAYITYKTPYEFFLSLLTVGLAVSLIAILAFMNWKSPERMDFHRTFVVTVVIFAALFLMVAGYTDQQVAPAFGLLGAIVGYVFGRETATSGTVKVVPPPPQPGVAVLPPQAGVTVQLSQPPVTVPPPQPGAAVPPQQPGAAGPL